MSETLPLDIVFSPKNIYVINEYEDKDNIHEKPNITSLGKYNVIQVEADFNNSDEKREILQKDNQDGIFVMYIAPQKTEYEVIKQYTSPRFPKTKFFIIVDVTDITREEAENDAFDYQLPLEADVFAIMVDCLKEELPSVLKGIEKAFSHKEPIKVCDIVTELRLHCKCKIIQILKTMTGRLVLMPYAGPTLSFAQEYK